MIKCNNKIIAKKKIFCNTIISKTIGLMFHKKPIDTGYIFIFNSLKNPLDISIHNFFVFFETDIIYLDSKKKIVDLKIGFKPFAPLFIPCKKSQYIIEFPSGIINKHNIKIGDIIEF